MNRLPTWTREEWLDAISRYRARQTADEPLTAETRRILARTSYPRDYSLPMGKGTAVRLRDLVRKAKPRIPWDGGAVALSDQGRKAGARKATRDELYEWWLAAEDAKPDAQEKLDAALLAQATAQAEAWNARTVSGQQAREAAQEALEAHVGACADGCEPFGKRCAIALTLAAHARYTGAGNGKPTKRPKRKGQSGGNIEVDALDALQERAAHHEVHSDPPTRLIAFEPRMVGGMPVVVCLKCGQENRRRDGSDRPCLGCGNVHQAPAGRDIDAYLGESYTLPAWWYGGQASTLDALDRHVMYRTERRGGFRKGSAGPVRLMARVACSCGECSDGREWRYMVRDTVSGRKPNKGRGKPRIGRSAAEVLKVDAATFLADTVGATVFQTIERG